MSFYKKAIVAGYLTGYTSQRQLLGIYRYLVPLELRAPLMVGSWDEAPAQDRVVMDTARAGLARYGLAVDDGA